MNTSEIAPTLATLLHELLEGTPKSGGYMLNGGDPGLLGSLDKLSASAASRSSTGGASIAAHVDHLRYGLSLMNRWGKGENPFAGADWTASWRKTSVSDEEWDRLRADFRTEATNWLEALRTPRDIDEEGMTGMAGSIAHLAYHMGAIRQIDRLARGPLATE
jgi:hypothetical protein